MNTISKLIAATAVVASFAAPALAVDYNSELQANNTSATATQVQTRTWTNSYAMDSGMWVGQPAGPVRGFDQINGGM